ncbi:FkbM family methyltransferase [Parachlamydia acanthamoebae]|uniref:FkbM family methyltransferase n=1 Tax=Parachlamydia acanthamoebae TaxID=83552 RepID=UPI000750C1BD|nr:FkbM family methyltransferase [Parachlamydia acanthamoebae]
MKILHSILFTLLALGSSGCKNLEENKDEKHKFTIFQNNLDSVVGPEDEVALLKAFPKALYKIYTIDNLGSFYIDSRVDLIKNQLAAGRAWEDNFIPLLEQYITPGTTVVDIGAHIGTHTLSMSKSVGSKGRVVAFEPQIKLYSELVMNMVLNKCQNVTIYRCALGDTFKSIEMNPSVAGNEGGTSIGSGGDSAEMITLDSLHLDNVSFIKMDVENFEYEVLLGAKETILRNRPYIILEIMGNVYNPIANRGELVQQTIAAIEQLGYSLKYIDGSWSDWLATPLERVNQ